MFMFDARKSLSIVTYQAVAVIVIVIVISYDRNKRRNKRNNIQTSYIYNVYIRYLYIR